MKDGGGATAVRGPRVRALDPEKRGGMDRRERGGAGGRLGGPFLLQGGHGIAEGAGARHGDSARTIATGTTTRRYYRQSLTGSTGEPTKTEDCYFIWALKQVQKFYKKSGRLSTR